ncbi:MAG: GntR family transcriptional regulator [Acetobacteraceae bacterium]
MSEAAQPLRVERDAPTLRELAARKLREAIVSLRFSPGEHLVERVLCEETGVSRSCIREALRHLESEGLIERRGGRGLFVSSITPDEARQIYEIRGALEPEIGRLFATRAADADHKALANTLDVLREAITAGDIAAYVGAFDAFYAVLCRGASNPLAHRILGTLNARITYLRTMTTAQASEARERETLALMRAIADAARRRASAEVARRCRDFVRRSQMFAMQVLAERSPPAPHAAAPPRPNSFPP